MQCLGIHTVNSKGRETKSLTNKILCNKKRVIVPDNVFSSHLQRDSLEHISHSKCSYMCKNMDILNR